MSDLNGVPLATLSMMAAESAKRLKRLIQLGSPNSIVEAEYDMLSKRMESIRERVGEMEDVLDEVTDLVQDYVEEDDVTTNDE